MRKMILAAAAVLALGSAPAFAGDSGDLPVTTTFTLIQQAQQQPSPAAHRYAAVTQQQVGDSTAAYPVHSKTLGTWLFAPNATGGGEQ